MCSLVLRTRVPPTTHLAPRHLPARRDPGAPVRWRREAQPLRREAHRHAVVDRGAALRWRSTRGDLEAAATEWAARDNARPGPAARPALRQTGAHAPVTA